MNWTMIVGWVVSPVCALVVGGVVASVRHSNAETKALKKAIQALLRDRLCERYRDYEQAGWVDIDNRNNFINLYEQYHNMGQNGVMDDIRDKFLALPTHPTQED